ncbi:MAG: HAD family hydrolase [Gammaproteobacteria bacterium]
MNIVAENRTSLLQAHRSVTSADLPGILSRYQHITTLSLDCFDTLVWRNTALPKDVFYEMQKSDICQQLGMTAYQRINAAARAYREANIQEGHYQISLEKIYQYFTSLSTLEQKQLIEEEIKTELALCYAFPPMVDVIREAHKLGLKIVIVSDTYLTQMELKRLLQHTLPADAASYIDEVFCSSEYKKSKSEGLFELIKAQLNAAPESILHIGDHEIADFKAPLQSGLHALHFIQSNQQISDYLHTQHTVAALTPLSYSKSANTCCYSPYRGLFALTRPLVEQPETSIGYLTFGPMLFAFAKFITEEIAALKAQGKKPKVFFLLRDAFLLSKACEAYEGAPLGKLVRLRKFVSVAASFKTIADIDHYLSSIKPQHFNMVVVGEQLLLPWEITQQLIQLAHQSPQPERRFYEVIRSAEVTKLVFEKSAEYRKRLKRYIEKEMDIQAGDTVVLVDTGYIGVTQEFFTRTFQDELNIEILGRYFMGSNEPDRPHCKSLLTSTWCEHGLFEQSCTYKEGAVLDYDEQGDPVFDKIRLTDQQYQKVATLQNEALRFIHDAKQFFADVGKMPALGILQEYAASALKRHVFFPNQAEITYFSTYQHDKDMGPDLKKTMFDMRNTHALQRQPSISHLHPYEARTVGLQATLNLLMQKGFDLDFKADKASFIEKDIQIVLITGGQPALLTVKAVATQDGYFQLDTPIIKNEQVCLLFGKHYQWVQLDFVNVRGNHLPAGVSVDKQLMIDQMVNKGGNLFECGEDGKLILLPVGGMNEHYFNVVFRPVVER